MNARQESVGVVMPTKARSTATTLSVLSALYTQSPLTLAVALLAYASLVNAATDTIWVHLKNDDLKDYNPISY